MVTSKIRTTLAALLAATLILGGGGALTRYMLAAVEPGASAVTVANPPDSGAAEPVPPKALEQATHLDFSVQGNRVLVEGVVRGETVRAEADRARYAEAESRLILESKGVDPARMQTRRGTATRDIGGNRVIYSLLTNELSAVNETEK